MYTLASKPPDWFTLGTNVRQKNSAAYSEEELRRLGESMRVRQIEPVGATPDGVLRWGFRRVLAALLVKFESVLTVIASDDLDESGWKVIALQENLLRAEMTDVEVYLACKDLLALNANWRNVDLAKSLHLPAYEVTRIMAPDDAIPPVREAFLAGKLSKHDTYTISRGSEAEQLDLFNARLNGATSKQLARQRSKPANEATEAVKTGSLKIMLGNGVTVTVKGSDLTLATAAELLERASKEAEKAKAQGLNARTAERVWRDRAGKQVNATSKAERNQE